MNNADYIRAVRPHLPPDALRPNPWAGVPIAIHLTIVVACIVASRYTPSAYWPVLGLVAGISRGALSFLAHDVSHRTVVTHRYLMYPVELILWGMVFMPATMWRRVHHAHHVHSNGVHDPERRWLQSELTNPVSLVSAALITPNRTLKYNVFCFMYWSTWMFRNGAAMLYAGESPPGCVPAKSHYSKRQALSVVFETIFIILLQIAIWRLVKGAYIWVSIVPALIGGAFVSWYFFTNHGLKPVDDGHDVLAATTSVTVPAFCDVLHSNFSYHTEHHLFPGMNPKYYPLVRRLLQQHFPEQLHCIPITEAWSGLWNSAMGSVRSDEASVPRRPRRSSPLRPG
jgi:fatty acid desaturase